MARGLQNYPNIDSADADFPNGKIRDRDGSTQGTPVNEFVYGDIHQFFAKLLRVSNITPNELPDSEYNLHQYYDALLKAVNYDALSYVVRSMTNYANNDVLILWGCTLTINLPGTCSITDGAIYYNGIVYNVDAMSISVVNPNTCIFRIDTTVVPNKIIIAQGPSGTGIADAGSPFAGNVTRIDTGYLTSGGVTMLNSWTRSSDLIFRKFMKNFSITGNVQKSFTPSANVDINETFMTITDTRFSVLNVTRAPVIVRSLNLSEDPVIGELYLTGGSLAINAKGVPSGTGGIIGVWLNINQII